jgi:hypothetical protein
VVRADVRYVLGRNSRRALIFVVALAVGALCASGAAAARVNCSKSYSYAGLVGSHNAHGIRTKLTAVKSPDVNTGHVAGWVGVGGEGMGPNGTTEWIQVGFSGFGDGQSTLYFEVTRPYGYPTYHAVMDVQAGESHRVGVSEMRNKRDWWRVWVDGHTVSKPIHLPGSHGTWQPVATAESWNADSGKCNSYAYRFSRVAFATRANRGWKLMSDAYKLEDTGYRVSRSDGGFVARGAI